MVQAARRAIDWVEQGLVPDAVVRAGIRRLCEQRLREIDAGHCERAATALEAFVARMDAAELAPVPHLANEQHYEVPAGFDFIKRYIFPGCCIPSVGALTTAVVASSDLRVVHLEDIGPHYATTLAAWRRNFHANLERVRALGYPATFLRLWEFYLCYCEAGFAERALGDVQVVLTREG